MTKEQTEEIESHLKSILGNLKKDEILKLITQAIEVAKKEKLISDDGESAKLAA
jgi:hypothetical protein